MQIDQSSKLIMKWTQFSTPSCVQAQNPVTDVEAVLAIQVEDNKPHGGSPSHPPMVILDQAASVDQRCICKHSQELQNHPENLQIPEK